MGEEDKRWVEQTGGRASRRKMIPFDRSWGSRPLEDAFGLAWLPRDAGSSARCNPSILSVRQQINHLPAMDKCKPKLPELVCAGCLGVCFAKGSRARKGSS
ncbi:hypothetical protein F5Y17DRAFT_461717 [Xylariaceae sp. FL0594]|nr:hypothetical protein F5Y17DRAFT_461717 [Xylariaceae sp. FL0594]